VIFDQITIPMAIRLICYATDDVILLGLESRQ
jgi:hypothetical protein